MRWKCSCYISSREKKLIQTLYTYLIWECVVESQFSLLLCDLMFRKFCNLDALGDCANFKLIYIYIYHWFIIITKRTITMITTTTTTITSSETRSSTSIQKPWISSSSLLALIWWVITAILAWRRVIATVEATLWHLKPLYIVRELTGVPVHPPMILREWYHFVQGTLRNHICYVTRKKLGLTTNFSHFFKMAASKSEISNISEITSCRIMIWV